MPGERGNGRRAHPNSRDGTGRRRPHQRRHPERATIHPAAAGGLITAATVVICTVLAYTSCWWPFSESNRCIPIPPSTHMFLIDVSEGTDPKKDPKKLREIVRSLMSGTRPKDKVIVSQTTSEIRSPTQKITRFETPVTKGYLDSACRQTHGKLPACGTPPGSWPQRLVNEKSQCGKEEIIKACEAEQKIEAEIKNKLVFQTGSGTQYSPIVEAIEFSEKTLQDSGTPAERREIHIYSDMVQNSPWYSMIEREQGYIDFHKWSDWALYKKKRNQAVQLFGLERPVKILTNKVVIHQVPRRRYLRGDARVRKCKKFWEGLLRFSEVEWKDVDAEQHGAPGAPK